MNWNRWIWQAARSTRGQGRWLWAGLARLSLGLGLWMGVWDAFGQTPPATAAAEAVEEGQAFDAARRSFEDGFFERAAREFDAFSRRFPASTRRPEAVLMQARANLRQQQPLSAVSLLATNLAQAGLWAEPYRYWLAQAYLDSTNYAAAAEAFARLARDFTNSVRLLEAGYGEAMARFQMREWPRVVQLLEDPKGTFRRAIAQRGTNELAVRGELLLAEALIEQRQYATAETLLSKSDEAVLLAADQWRRSYLLARVYYATDRWSEALVLATNMLGLASKTAQRGLLAESYAVQGMLQEKRGHLADAVSAYENNLKEGTPTERRREALLKVVQLTLASSGPSQAFEKLGALLERHPEETATDTGLFVTGELYLKSALASVDNAGGGMMVTNATPSMTNLVQQALARFHQLLTNYPHSSLAGQAWLGAGWCSWIQGQWTESKQRFARAYALLPFSPDQANALFKWADSEFRLQDYTNAVAHYRMLLKDFIEISEVRLSLFDHALYQVIQASLRLGNVAEAEAAMNQLLAEQPTSAWVDRAMLLVGQSLSQAGRSAQAKVWLERALTTFPDRALAPEVELALAKVHARDQEWGDAMTRYDAWMSRYATSELPAASNLLARAQFEQATITAQAGQTTNAVQLFLAFLDRYSGHELAPFARLWIGDYYFGERDYVNAQIHYQDVALLASPLACNARMMAGRAAFAGERWTDAIDHFKALLNLNDIQCPTNTVIEAYFGLGDTYTRQSASRERPSQKFEEAIAVFSKVPQLYPDNPRVPQAWGRIGDCHLALAAMNPTHYDAATNAYGQALLSPLADADTRIQAEVRLAMTKELWARSRLEPERLALLKEAQDHFLNIVYGANPALQAGESPDPFWLKEAGLGAARLAEEFQQWEVAIRLYERLASALPPIRASLQRRIDKAREQMGP